MSILVVDNCLYFLNKLSTSPIVNKVMIKNVKVDLYFSIILLSEKSYQKHSTKYQH